MTNLKPCPFCGSENVEVFAARSSDRDPHLPDCPMWVGCNNCDATGPSLAIAPDPPQTMEQADKLAQELMRKWNERK